MTTIEDEARGKIMMQIDDERRHQIRKFGAQRRYDYDRWMSVLGEEHGEACKALNDASLFRSDRHYTKYEHAAEFRRELIQVAAVAVAIIEQMDSTPNLTL